LATDVPPNFITRRDIRIPTDLPYRRTARASDEGRV
jgi:hypothetical protein